MLTFLLLSVNVEEISLATILSLKYVNNISGVRMTIGTSIEKSMSVNLSHGRVFKFKECILGLYYYFMASIDDHNSAKTNATITPYSLLSTVTKNKEFYTHVDIEGAAITRGYQGIIGWPATSDLKHYVNKSLLLNCNITVDEKADLNT